MITASVAPRYIAFEPAGRNSAVIAGATADLTDETIVVGAKAFTEQYILGALLESRMEAAGARIDRRDNLGSTIAFDALRTGEIDVYIDYSGTIWATVMNRPEPIHRHAMLAEMTGWLWAEHGILALGGLGFENAYGFAMAREQAAALGVTSLADLAPLAEQMTVGGDAEVFSRPEWVMTRDLYGLGAMQTRAMDAAFMYGAVRDGQVDMISAYTTDGRIAAFDLIVLDDPAAVLPPYDAVILLSPDAAANPALVAILAELVGAIDDELMREANRQVDLDRQTPDQAARWLAETLEAGGADR